MPPPTAHPAVIFDRAAIRRHRARAKALAGAGGDAGFLFREAADRLWERLADVNRRFNRALDLDSRDESLGDRLVAAGIETVRARDLPPRLEPSHVSPELVVDLEALPFAPGSFDLVLSGMAMHWVNDLPGTLLQLRHVLKPDGLLLINLLGGETLTELRTALIEAESEIENGASPRVSPFADARDLAGLLQRAGFALPVVDSDRLTVTYPDALRLMQDLRAMGETNALILRNKEFSRRGTLLRAASLYRERFAAEDGRIPAQFEIVTLTAWAPHESQPQAKRPGSAAARLAEALGTVEEKAGDKAVPSHGTS